MVVSTERTILHAEIASIDVKCSSRQIRTRLLESVGASVFSFQTTFNPPLGPGLIANTALSIIGLGRGDPFSEACTSSGNVSAMAFRASSSVAASKMAAIRSTDHCAREESLTVVLDGRDGAGWAILKFMSC